MISRPALASCRCLLVCAWCLCITTLACRQADDPAHARGSTVVVSHRQADEAALRPGSDTWAKFLVFLPLLGWNEEGELEGRLARSWEHSTDYREWTYHLRTDVRWHDGMPVTAHDVKFTLELLSHPDVLLRSQGYIESVTVSDDSTVTIRSIEHGIEQNSWMVYYPRHVLENLDPKRFSEWEFWTHPVGNGPYRFVRYVPQTAIEFEANTDYYRGKPRIERVVLKFDPEGRLTELLSGNVDVISVANPVEIPALGEDPRFRVLQEPDGDVRVLAWKCDHPLFRDARVRRALTLAIDRHELQRLLNIGATIPVADGIVPVWDQLRGRAPPPLPYDPDRARALLGEAGWVDRDGDGIRERGGRPFRFALLVRGSGRGPWGGAAVFVRAQLLKVGVWMELQPLDHAVVGDRLRSGEFEAALEWGGTGVAWLREMFGEESPLGYRNPVVAELIERLAGTADPAEQRRIHWELIRIFQEEAPATFLGPVAWTVFVHRRLRGLSSPWRTHPLQFMEELWLEEQP